MGILNINGKPVVMRSPSDTPLLWVLRDELGLTGTKFGCGEGLCGACTVHIDGEATRSCITEAGSVVGKRITTIEALAADKIGQAVQRAWVELDVVQCGYCQSGQCMAAAALLAEHKKPTDDNINEAMFGNLCRCGTYHRIRQAVHLAASKLPA
jgi:isoquinoline 1-oxidoreductase subunit alpha